MLEAFLAELAEAGPDAATAFSRLALTLNKASRDELQTRVLAILDEFVTRARPRRRALRLLFSACTAGRSPPAGQDRARRVAPRS
jgi:hypothetical protein